MQTLNKILRENLIFLVAALLPYVSMPAIVHAQGGNVNPILFTEPMKLSRGDFMPESQNSFYLEDDDYCKIAVEDWGWQGCPPIEAFVLFSTEDTDTLMIDPPNSDGFVKLDDWKSEDRDSEISQIENEIRASLVSQSERLGQPVSFAGWKVYPTLDEEAGVLYYSTDIDFGGEISTNVKATKFDRRGYIIFNLVPISPDLSAQEIDKMIQENLALYTPKESETRAAFQAGDKVAAVGALGVLATLVGVKYGKSAATGFLAAAAILLKKFWFILLLPIFWLKSFVARLFNRKDQ